MGSKNKDVLERAIGFFTTGDVENLKTVMTDDIAVTVPGSSQISGQYKGQEDFLTNFIGKAMQLTAGQFTLKPHDLLGSDEHAVGVYNMSATRDGKTFEWRQVNIYHVRDSKVAEVFVNVHEFEAWNAFWS